MKVFELTIITYNYWTIAYTPKPLFWGGGGVSSLHELFTSIGQLNAIQNLDLRGCWDLQNLPTSIG